MCKELSKKTKQYFYFFFFFCKSDAQMYILEACQLLVQEVNHNRAEHKTGEYCKKSCNA